MSRIAGCFSEAKRNGRKVLVGYLTAGDPDLEKSEENIRAAVKNGVDVLELGVPFSDPTADGPEIQAASGRALASGMDVARCFRLAASVRRFFDGPIVLFGYTNPFYKYGFAKLCRDAARVGVDGFLVVDMPHEESGELTTKMKRYGLDFITLVAPTTPLDRMRRILGGASGFVYYIMFRGVTGVRKGLPVETVAKLRSLRRTTSLPVVAGFGVSGGKQARMVTAHADGVVVGSAFVRAARERRLGGLVREIRRALDRKS